MINPNGNGMINSGVTPFATPGQEGMHRLAVMPPAAPGVSPLPIPGQEGRHTLAGIPPAAPPTPPPASYTPTVAAPSTAISKGYNPVGTVVIDDDTVQGQLDKVLAKDSKVIQRADARSRAAMAGNGMINSTMGLQAGQAAVIDAAMPIAQQDAQTNFTANQKTVDAQNAAGQFGAAAGNQVALANAQLTTDVSKANAGMINEAGARNAQAANEQMIARLDADTRVMLSSMDSQTKTSLATMDAANRQLLQQSQAAQDMFKQTVADITAITQNEKLTPDAKDAAVQTAINLLREGLAATAEVTRTETEAVGSLNLEKYFQPAATGKAGDPTTFSDLPLTGSIPTGGTRDEQGNVFNADGSPTTWRGPVGQPVRVDANGKSIHPTPTAPTGTVTNPAQGSGPRQLTPAEQINRNVIPWPGARWDNRSGWRV